MTADTQKNVAGQGQDAALIERIRTGDRPAFMAFYDRFSPLLFSVAARVLGDRKEAEDVLQEVMLVIWNKSGEYDPELGSLSSWTVALTRNRALDRLRARTRRLRLIEEVAIMAEDADVGSTPSVNEVIHGRERAELLHTAMKDLPTDQRMAIELAFFTGLSQSDIAQRLQQPLGTIKARIRRGMLRLREQLGSAVIDERLQEQASLYALGALDSAELREFEAALRENAELRKLVRELRGVTEMLAGSAPALEPPASVKARLLMQIDEQRRPGTGNMWVPWALAAGLAIVSFGLLYQFTGLKAQVASQAHRIEELGMSLQLAQSESGELRQTVAKLRESNRLAAVRIALLDSLVSADPKAVAVSVWDNDRQNGVFIVKNLKPAPANKDYQLWIIDPKYPSPVDAGVFQVDAKGDLRQEFRAKAPIESAKQFAVTIEKKGGAEVPDTKAMVLAGA